jgi:hypothetical protein
LLAGSENVDRLVDDHLVDIGGWMLAAIVAAIAINSGLGFKEKQKKSR